MGVAVAGAVGAALAEPERRTVALVGDSAFSMHGLEVLTAVELGLPIVWITLNNSGHGMVFQGDHLMRRRDLGASRFHHALSAKGIAQAVGAQGLEVGPDGTLAEVLERALASRLPTVIDVKVPIGAISPTLKRRVDGLANYIGKPPSFRMQPK